MAERAAGGGGEALAFLKGKAAVVADRWGDAEPATGPRGQGDVSQVVQHLLLRQGEALGELQAGEYALQQQFFDHLTLGLHRDSCINILREAHGSLMRRARRPINWLTKGNVQDNSRKPLPEMRQRASGPGAAPGCA